MDNLPTIETSNANLVTTPIVRTRKRTPTKRGKSKRSAPAKFLGYKVICISMYTRDLDSLDAKVSELKRQGFTRANKSQLIRLALRRLDLATLVSALQPDALESTS